MKIYSMKTDRGVAAFAWVHDRAIACLFPSFAALGLQMSALCATHGWRVVYEVPPDVRAAARLVSPTEFGHLLTGRHAQAGAGRLPAPDVAAESITVLGAPELRAVVAALHAELDAALDAADWDRARQVATRLGWLRREFSAA